MQTLFIRDSAFPEHSQDSLAWAHQVDLVISCESGPLQPQTFEFVYIRVPLEHGVRVLLPLEWPWPMFLDCRQQLTYLLTLEGREGWFACTCVYTYMNTASDVIASKPGLGSSLSQSKSSSDEWSLTFPPAVMISV